MPVPDHLAVACVGNTRARLGVFDGSDLARTAVLNADDTLGPQAVAFFTEQAAAGKGVERVVLCSVNDRASGPLESALQAAGIEPARLIRDIPVPMKHTLQNASTLGHDRIALAAGAYEKCQQACVVVDLGTAITVDFIDGEGTFHGGVIAPGLSMMLRALSEFTDALPAIEYKTPEAISDPFGADTPDAMRRGVRAAVRGLVRQTVEEFAIHYEAYPKVIATGGDAGLLEDDGLVDHTVPDLELHGVRAALALALDDQDE